MLKDMAQPENNDFLSLRQVAKEINKVLEAPSGQIKIQNIADIFLVNSFDK